MVVVVVAALPHELPQQWSDVHADLSMVCDVYVQARGRRGHARTI